MCTLPGNMTFSFSFSDSCCLALRFEVTAIDMLGQRWTPESSGKQVPAHLVCTGGPLGVATLHWTCLKLVNSEELARAGFAGGGSCVEHGCGRV